MYEVFNIWVKFKKKKLKKIVLNQIIWKFIDGWEYSNIVFSTTAQFPD